MVTRVWTDHDQILKRCWKHFASCAWPARPAGTACRAAAPFRLRASPRRCRRIHRPRPRIQARAVRYQRRDAAEKGGRRAATAPHQRGCTQPGVAPAGGEPPPPLLGGSSRRSPVTARRRPPGAGRRRRNLPASSSHPRQPRQPLQAARQAVASTGGKVTGRREPAALQGPARQAARAPARCLSRLQTSTDSLLLSLAAESAPTQAGRPGSST